MKEKTVFFCTECGYESSKWMGKCLGCGAWNLRGVSTALLGGVGSRRVGVFRVRGDRKTNDERRSFAERAFDADFSGVFLDDALAKSEPESGAALAGFVRAAFGRVKRVEDFRKRFRRNPGAEVANGDLDEVRVFGASNFDDDSPAARRRLPRVDQEVDENLLNLVPVRQDRRNRLVSRFDRDAVLAGLSFEEEQHVVDERLQIGRFSTRLAVARQAENDADDFRRSLRRVQNLRKRFFAGFVVVATEPHLRVIDRQRQNIIELVRRRSGQFADRDERLRFGQHLFKAANLFFQFGDFGVARVLHRRFFFLVGLGGERGEGIEDGANEGASRFRRRNGERRRRTGRKTRSRRRYRRFGGPFLTISAKKRGFDFKFRRKFGKMARRGIFFRRRREYEASFDYFIKVSTFKYWVETL